MDLRIVVPDAANACSLAERLTAVRVERISLSAHRQEVEVRIGEGSDRAILRLVDAVERWLEHAAAGSAEMWLGNHSYRLTRSVPVETWQ